MHEDFSSHLSHSSDLKFHFLPVLLVHIEQGSVDSWCSPLVALTLIHVFPEFLCLTSTMQNGNSTWCVLQSSLLFIHFSVAFTVTDDFPVVVFLLQFVKVKATNETKLPLKPLRYSPPTGTLFSCVQVLLLKVSVFELPSAVRKLIGILMSYSLVFSWSHLLGQLNPFFLKCKVICVQMSS